MKILYVCHEPLPSSSTSTEQLMKAASAMAALGVDVSVSTPARDCGDVGAKQREVAEFYGIDSSLFGNGLALACLPGPALIGGEIGRPWHDVRAAVFGGRQGFDVLYVRDPIPLVTTLATGLPVVFETYRYDLNSRPFYAPWRALCYGREQLLGVVTHSNVAKQSFVDVGFNKEQLCIAHNGFEPPTSALPGRLDARRELDLERESALVVYAGGVSEEKGLESIVSVAAGLRGVKFLVVGHEPGSRGESWFRGEVASRGLSNMRLVARVPPARVATYLAAADCLIIPTSSKPLYNSGRTVLPLKTFRYLAVGRPIVAPDLPDLREVLVDEENALLVPPDRSEHTIEAVERVLGDGVLAETLSQGALASARRNTWKNRAENIKTFIDRRVAGTRVRSGTGL